MTARAGTATSQAAPLRFLLAVVTLWIAGRGAVLFGWSPPVDAAPSPPPAGVTPVAGLPGRYATLIRARTAVEPDPDVAPRPPPLLRRRPIRLAAGASEVIATNTPTLLRLTAAAPDRPAPAFGTGGIVAATKTDAGHPAGVAPSASTSRWSGSAWAFVRGGGRATALSPGGQIGGGQAGIRTLYRLDDAGRIALAARFSHTIGGARQSEAALGLDWKPIAALPLHLMADRRIAIDTGGRNAWTLGAAGGVYAVPLGGHWRLDGYGEAGVVGTHRRDLYADGAVRIARAIDLGAGTSLALGGGAWGAAQPGAARVDIGPSAVLRLPVEGRAVALALDWRERLTGEARPDSGIAFTAAIDF